jgi:hypothetical protein
VRCVLEVYQGLEVEASPFWWWRQVRFCGANGSPWTHVSCSIKLWSSLGELLAQLDRLYTGLASDQNDGIPEI